MLARRVLLEEFHRSVLISKEVSNIDVRAMNRVLARRRFDSDCDDHSKRCSIRSRR